MMFLALKFLSYWNVIARAKFGEFLILVKTIECLTMLTYWFGSKSEGSQNFLAKDAVVRRCFNTSMSWCSN